MTPKARLMPKAVMQKLEAELETAETNKLQGEINGMPNLLTYKELKIITGTEHYVYANIKKYHRSLIAKFRTGTFPINIELGRHQRKPVEERTFPHCTTLVKDERHFLLMSTLQGNTATSTEPMKIKPMKDWKI